MHGTPEDKRRPFRLTEPGATSRSFGRAVHWERITSWRLRRSHALRGARCGVGAMPVSEETYLRVAQEDPGGKWELHCGQLRSKEPMTWEHIRTGADLGYTLQHQLDRRSYVVVSESGRVRRSATQYYVPDAMVIPVAMATRLFPVEGMVASFPEPLPLVVEVWSPSTGR